MFLTYLFFHIRTYDPSKGCNTDSIQYVDAYRTNICINSYITSVFVNDTTVTQYELADCRGSISVQYDYNAYDGDGCFIQDGIQLSIAVHKLNNNDFTLQVIYIMMFLILLGFFFIGRITSFVNFEIFVNVLLEINYLKYN